ncbi:glycosyltransferase [Streptacidiphilus sp. MAP12-16]|uniref:glycosyltransferase n=1 Tax=Streptacidiphilus sp. MAP12-16 TaxID=3156300 RepID=UPI003517F0FC
MSRAVPPVAILLWFLSLRRVHLERMGDLGLLEVLPVLFWIALGLLTLGFVVTLRAERVGRVWPAVYVVALIAILHATPSVLYPTLRYSWAWKHVDVVDALLRNGGAVPHPGWLDIYNQWPGFFVANGLVLRFTGLHSAMGYAHWATPVANVLLIGPLLLLYRTITHDRKLIWGAVWIFFSCSWIGQDYFAPQTFGFLLFVTVIALVLKQLPTQGPPGAHPVHAWVAPHRPARGSSGGGWRPGLFVMVVLMEAVLVSSHQLTPLMLIATLTVLSLPRRNRGTVLPVLACAVLLQAVWFCTVARPYITANLGNFIKAVTSPDSNAPTWLTGLGTPAPGQILLAWVDRSLSAAVILLAVIALFRRPWTRRTALPLLAVAPLPMPALNSYGGEMIFRAFLFSLPATAMLIAALVMRARPPIRLRAVASFVLLLCFLGGLVFGYYGKEQMEYFTAREAAATAYLDRVAPTGSTIVSVTNNIPNIDNDYDLHNRVVIAWNSTQNRRLLLRDPLAGLEEAVALDAPPGPVYLILNRGQTAECYITGVLPANTVSRLEAAVDRSRIFAPVFRNADAVVYVLVDRTAPALQPRPQQAKQSQQSQQSQQQGGGR